MNFIYDIITKLILMMYSLLGDYGLAIIGVTILIKLVLLPLTLKQDNSMKAMKKVQPEIDKIKAQYKDDPQTLNKKTMELYQTHKVNPAAGCLPLLLQMPILFALFGVLRKAAEPGGFLQDNPSFLWLKLAEPDPIYILPLLNGVISFVQQKMMGSDANPQTKQMMYIFPVMMVFISYKMPAGLQVYWFVSSAAGLLQQYFIMKRGDEA